MPLHNLMTFQILMALYTLMSFHIHMPISTLMPHPILMPDPILITDAFPIQSLTIYIFIFCRAPRPVPSCLVSYLSLTRSLPV